MRTRSGEPQSGRLRVVCASCNNGWMSDLQQEAKPHLLPLIKGETYLLHRNAQKTLAAWIAMFAMVAEHVDKTGTRIPIRSARSLSSVSSTCM